MVTLGEGVTVDFPAPPESSNNDNFIGYSLALTTPAGGEARFIAGRANIAYPYRWIMRQAPYCAEDALGEQILTTLQENFPGAVLEDEYTFELEGFNGIEFELRDIPPDASDSSKPHYDHIKGRAIIINGDVYLYTIADQSNKPVADAIQTTFLNSLQTTHTFEAGDGDVQFRRLVGLILAAGLLILILFVATIIWCVKRIKRRRSIDR